MPRKRAHTPFRIQIIVDPSLEYFREVLLGVRRYGFESGQLEFADRWLPHEMESLTKVIRRDRIDGIVVAIDTVKFENQLRETGCPVVNISNSLRVPEFPVVTQDDIEVGRFAARHLQDCGCRSFAFLGHAGASYSDQRWIGFRETLPNVEPPHLIRFPSNPISSRQFGQIRSWIEELPRPAGIFAVLDSFALIAQRAARESNLRVPEDIAILGAGDDDFQVELEQIPLSSVRLPSRQIGYAAGELMAGILSEQIQTPESIYLPVSDIALRRSTDIQYADDPKVAKAVRLIRDQPSIRVAEVARAVGMARSGLQRRFHQTLGRGILSEIQRVRLTRAQSLLTSGNEKLEQVAEQAGYASVQRLSACFREALGQSPGEFRKRMRTSVDPSTRLR